LQLPTQPSRVRDVDVGIGIAKVLYPLTVSGGMNLTTPATSIDVGAVCPTTVVYGEPAANGVPVVIPPSMGNMPPVTQAASSEAR
jgi:hypothetical protein